MGVLLAVLAAAVAFRLWLLAVTDFPIADGALFYEFVRAIERTFPGLPDAVRYNGLVLPFGYPPLSFWLAALLVELGFEALNVVRAMPIAMNIGYVLLFALLLVRSGQSRLFAGLAVLFLITRLRGFEWLVMGGGLSRGLGSLFFLATLLAVGVPHEREVRPMTFRRAALAGVCVGLAMLSHLEWGLLAATTLLWSRALGAQDLRSFVLTSLVAGLIAILLVVPWAGSVVANHGLAPFLAAGDSSEWGFPADQLLSLLRIPGLNPFIGLGAVALFFHRRWFWLGFLFICVFVTPRGAPTQWTLPLSVFAAQGVLTAIAFLRALTGRRKLAAGLAAAAVLAVVGVRSYRDFTISGRFVEPLDPARRGVMAWVARHEPNARYAVLTDKPWYYDSSAEWFPTLARARSVTTVQGREWLSGKASYQRYQSLDEAMKPPGGDQPDCAALRRALAAFGPSDYLWVEARRECFPASVYRPVYASPQVLILRTPSGGPA